MISIEIPACNNEANWQLPSPTEVAITKSANERSKKQSNLLIYFVFYFDYATTTG